MDTNVRHRWKKWVLLNRKKILHFLHYDEPTLLKQGTRCVLVFHLIVQSFGKFRYHAYSDNFITFGWLLQRIYKVTRYNVKLAQIVRIRKLKKNFRLQRNSAQNSTVVCTYFLLNCTKIRQSSSSYLRQHLQKLWLAD